MMSRFSFITNDIHPNSRINDAGKRIHHREPGATGFIAVDGEGIFVDDEHRYALLGVGSDQIENENGLTWQEIFSFLYSHYKPSVAFVGFFLGYDFTQWLKGLPEDKAWFLLTEPGKALRQRKRGKNPTPFPVRCDGWEFDILGMKRLKIRPWCGHLPTEHCKCAKERWMYICDVGGFFQQSFLAVINPRKWVNPVVTDEEYSLVEAGKAKRSDQTHVDADMRKYNAMENEILVRVMEQLKSGLREIGVTLPAAKWFGPGQAAQAWLKNEGVTPSQDLMGKIPQWALEAARQSYIAGWFELMMHGYIKGVTHEYDINSAYPYIIAKLPCLEHGEWSMGQGLPNVMPGEMCLVRARVWTYSNLSSRSGKRKAYIGAMLHRSSDGSISRPTVTEGWYWWHELEAAKRAKCIQPFPRKTDQEHLSSECFEWVKYSPCDCQPPMRRVVDLYIKRKEVGKDTPLGKGAKTSYNSMYGKFAQSVGHPVFGNPIYASLITAGCREMILDAIATHPGGKANVAMVATDAVYFLDPHPSLNEGDGLGQWEHAERRNLSLFKPGVYWDDKARNEVASGESPHFKARGISASDFGPQLARIDKEFQEWRTNPPGSSLSDGGNNGWPIVKFTSTFSMVSCLQAIHRHDWELAGNVSDDDERTQSAAPWQKRTNVYYDAERDIFRSEPYTPDLIQVRIKGEWRAEQDCKSVPYEKRFGMDDPFSDDMRHSMGVSPDGNVYELIGYAMKGITE